MLAAVNSCEIAIEVLPQDHIDEDPFFWDPNLSEVIKAEDKPQHSVFDFEQLQVIAKEATSAKILL